MYQSKYIIPKQRQVMYQNYPNNTQNDRFLAPFLIGGIAGTALGYGISNNNYNRPPYYVPYQPYQYVPYNNNYYYYY